MIKKNIYIINSIIAATVLTANAVIVVFPINFIVSFILIIGLISSLYFNRFKLIKRHKILIFFILFVFLLSFIYRGFENDILNNYFLHFLVMGVTGIIVSQYEFDIKYFFCFLFVFAIICLPFFLGRNIDLNSGENYMGLTYALLKLIVAALVMLLLPYKNLYKIAALVVFLSYMSQYVLFASRGAYVAIISFVAFSIAMYVKISYRKFLFLSIPLIILFFYCFEPIINSLQSFLFSQDISVYAINKSINKMEFDDVDNGRYSIWIAGLSMFWDSPLFGHGIAAYEIVHHSIYVHNVFVEMLIEGGIIVLFLFVVTFNYSLKMIFSNNMSYDEKLFMAFLVSTIIFPLCFSETFWHLQYFWFYVGYVLKKWHPNKLSFSYR